jgi:hypothetical protein
LLQYPNLRKKLQALRRGTLTGMSKSNGTGECLSLEGNILTGMRKNNVIAEKYEIVFFMMLRPQSKMQNTSLVPMTPLSSLRLLLPSITARRELTKDDARERKTPIMTTVALHLETRPPQEIRSKKKQTELIEKLSWLGKLHLKSFALAARLLIHLLFTSMNTKTKKKRSFESSPRLEWKSIKAKALMMHQMPTSDWITYWSTQETCKLSTYLPSV